MNHAFILGASRESVITTVNIQSNNISNDKVLQWNKGDVKSLLRATLNNVIVIPLVLES